jgi:hypothetical protein
VLHPEAPDLAGAHSGKAATDGSAGAGWIAGRRVTGLRKRVTGLNERKSISRARETGRAAPLRRDRREGLQAVWQAGKAPARADGIGNWESQARASRVPDPQSSRAAGRQQPDPIAGRSPEIGRLNLWVGGWWVQHQRRRKDSPLPSAGEQAAHAQAQARAPTQACMRA